MVRKRKQKNEGGAPAWQTTFSDLMSLLLTFFILLFSMSTVSEEHFRQAAESLRAALIGSSSDGILDHNGQTIADFEFDSLDGNSDLPALNDQGELEGSNQENVIPEEVNELYETVMGYMEAEGIESEVTITRDAEGVYIDIKEAVLFSPGSAIITSSGRETLGTLAGLFDLFDNQLIIEGFTDDVPMNTSQFPSNWELSTARAVSVLRYLSEAYGLDPSRLSATGYGEHRPIVPNDSEENRAQNRRVNMVIVHEEREEVDSGTE